MVPSLEVYECKGCGGEVAVIDAIWLPERKRMLDILPEAQPYCCQECYERNTLYTSHDD